MTPKERANNLMDFNTKEKALEIAEGDINFFTNSQTTGNLRIVGYLQSVKQELLKNQPC